MGVVAANVLRRGVITPGPPHPFYWSASGPARAVVGGAGGSLAVPVRAPLSFSAGFLPCSAFLTLAFGIQTQLSVCDLSVLSVPHSLTS